MSGPNRTVITDRPPETADSYAQRKCDDVPSLLGKGCRAAARELFGREASSKHPDLIVVNPAGVYVGLKQDRNSSSGFKASTYSEISRSEAGTAITSAALQARVTSGNNPASIRAGIEVATAVDQKLVGLRNEREAARGKPLSTADTDLADDKQRLTPLTPGKARGAAATETARQVSEAVKTRPELIAELKQRQDELKNMKDKDYPALKESYAPGATQSLRAYIDQNLNTQITALQSAENDQRALNAYNQAMNPQAPSVAPPINQPAGFLDNKRP